MFLDSFSLLKVDNLKKGKPQKYFRVQQVVGAEPSWATTTTNTYEKTGYLLIFSWRHSDLESLSLSRLYHSLSLLLPFLLPLSFVYIIIFLSLLPLWFSVLILFLSLVFIILCVNSFSLSLSLAYPSHCHFHFISFAQDSSLSQFFAPLSVSLPLPFFLPFFLSPFFLNKDVLFSFSPFPSKCLFTSSSKNV